MAPKRQDRVPGLRHRQTLSAPAALAVVLVCLCAGTFARFASAADHKPAPLPTVNPAFLVPVEPLGYTPASDAYLTVRPSFVTLDFLDENHLLFTFHKAGLMRRLADCAPDDQDQQIVAQVIELPSGKVVKSADWRMHDHSRYLWPIGGGHFLVRQRDSLFVTGQSLELEPFLEFSKRLQSLRVSPDHRLLIAQVMAERHTPEEHKQLAEQADQSGTFPPSEDVQLMVIDIARRKVIGLSRLHHTTDIAVVRDGHLEILPGKKNQWLIRYAPFRGESRPVGDIVSSCSPSVTVLNPDAALFFTCDAASQAHPVHAMDLDGKKLWDQVWESRYIWPTFSMAESGTRFAYSSLQLSHPVSTMDPIGDADVTAQLVGVFDTETGALRMVRNATPVTSAGQNFSVSPSGNRFAILRSGNLEIYDLPPVSVPPAEAAQAAQAAKDAPAKQ